MKTLIIVLLLSTQVFAGAKKVVTADNFFLEITENWRIRSEDDQVFSLRSENTSYGPMQSVSFLMGERQLKNLPAAKGTWLKWKTELVQMSERFPASTKCPHPLRFEMIKKGQELKSKSVCLNQLTDTERSSIQKLTQNLEQYLYGK